MEEEPFMNLKEKADAYAASRGLEITGILGDGTQGNVWTVRGKNKLISWALKLHARPQNYRVEKEVYLRLQDLGLVSLAGFDIPTLLRADDFHLALELSIVSPPYVLDFAQATLDWPPDFPDEVWEETRRRWRNLYGVEWPRVERLLGAIEAHGIHYLDVHPGNIALLE